jgi:hypothetical protein
MLYGHGKRGTESPIFVFGDNTPYWNYFAGQIQWLERLVESPQEPWASKGSSCGHCTNQILQREGLQSSQPPALTSRALHPVAGQHCW